MRFKANDGTMHRSQRDAYEHGQKASSVVTTTDDGGDEHGGIKSDPEAMQAIETLKSKGYSPEEVADCMRDDSYDEEAQPSPAGRQAVKAAPLQIPGAQ